MIFMALFTRNLHKITQIFPFCIMYCRKRPLRLWRKFLWRFWNLHNAKIFFTKSAAKNPEFFYASVLLRKYIKTNDNVLFPAIILPIRPTARRKTSCLLPRPYPWKTEILWRFQIRLWRKFCRCVILHKPKSKSSHIFFTKIRLQNLWRFWISPVCEDFTIFFTTAKVCFSVWRNRKNCNNS